MGRFVGAVIALSLLHQAAGQGRDDFDCPMREFALEYAQKIQPFRDATAFTDLADALNGTPEKNPNCTVGTSLKAVSGRGRFVQKPIRAGNQIYVDAQHGSDSNPGTIQQPLQTIGAAVTSSRASPGYDAIILRGGTYYLSDTIVLGPQDANLAFQSFPGEQAWVSGAQPLTSVTWQPYNVSANSTWVMYNNTNAIYADVPSSFVILNGTFPNWQQCESNCQANRAAGGPCTIWTWHDANQGTYALQCYFRTDNNWTPDAETGHISGRFQTGPNVWKADLSATGLNGVPGLRWNGKRMIRARYPNADPEFGFGPAFSAQWTPQQLPRTPDIQIDLPTPVRNTTVSMFQTFTAGIGGTCDRFSPPAGYWCSENVQGGGAQIYFAPIAMQVGQAQLPNTPYKNATGAIIQTWRPGHWASWAAEVGSAVFNATSGVTNFTVSRGFFQGSRGADTGDEVYMENVFEELDAAAEFYYDEVTQTLFFWHNDTAGTPPPTDGSIVVPQLKQLFVLNGTQDAPVVGVSFTGIGFRDTAYTYMDPHSIPSGGDWTMVRSAAVFLQGTEQATVSGCVFERVDGNAILVSAYNRNATLEYNEFAWIGESCIALWGNTEGGDDRLPEGYGQDGTAGNQPQYTAIVANLAHDMGVWEKQSSFVTQFKSSRNLIQGNIVYNGPRAHINFNDGFMGGSRLTENLLLNSCRESADHGPFNSWDRDPYIFINAAGETTVVKDYDVIDHNFIIANYHSLSTVDNDDGSSYYEAHDNFFVYADGGVGGMKNDFEGHDNIHHDNIYAFVALGLSNGYGGEIGSPGKGYVEGHQPQFFNNKVLLLKDGDYSKPVCSGVGTTVMYNNSIFSPTGNVTECGMALAQWQSQGNDQGTVAAAYPDTNTIITWGRELLW